MVVSPLLRLAFLFLGAGLYHSQFWTWCKNRAQSIGMRRIVTQVSNVDVGVCVFYPWFQHAAVAGFGAWMLPLVKNARLRAGT